MQNQGNRLDLATTRLSQGATAADTTMSAEALGTMPSGGFYATIMPEGELPTNKNSEIIYVGSQGTTAADYKLGGDTEQTGTPTPSTPVPINTVTGRQAITINSTEYEVNLGKNLFDKDNKLPATWSQNALTYLTFNLEPNTAYTFSSNIPVYIDSAQTQYANMFVYDSTQTGPGATNGVWNGHPSTVTTKSDGIIVIAYRSTGNTGTITRDNYWYQLEKGSTATSYAPYVQAFGKNLCDGISQGIYITAAITSAGKTTSDSGLAVAVLPNTDYTISTTSTQNRYRVGLVDSLPTLGSGGEVQVYGGENKDGTNSSITINSGARKYIVINATDLGIIQLEQGSTATAYEPNISGQLELCKLGESQDYLYKDNGKWYVHKAVWKTNTSEASSVIKSDTVTIGKFRFGVFFASSIPEPITSGGDDQMPGFCTGLTASTRGRTYQRAEDNIIALSDASRSYGYFAVYISAIETMDVASALSWLKTKAMDIYYPLETSLDIEITNTDLLAQLDALLGTLSDTSTFTSPYLPALPFDVVAAGYSWADITRGIAPTTAKEWAAGAIVTNGIYTASTPQYTPAGVLDKSSCVNAGNITPGAVTGVANSASTQGSAGIALGTVGTPNLRDQSVTSPKIDWATVNGVDIRGLYPAMVLFESQDFAGGWEPTLADSVTNYDYVSIEYGYGGAKNGGNIDMLLLPMVNGRVYSLGQVAQFNTATLFISNARVTITNNKLTYHDSAAVAFTNTGMSGFGTGNEVIVYRVIGWKNATTTGVVKKT